MERTLVLIKPDGIAQNIIGEIIDRFEKANLVVKHLKMFQGDKELFKAFYSVHNNKPFFDELVSWMSSSRIVAMILEGENAIHAVRKIIGATDPAEAEPGTIRATFGTDKGQNVVHASDSSESYINEARLIFGESAFAQD
ncbi:MAG: nucleoside-diphosphate kinase [Deltaproteobacteria bacterium]|nr:nucleoside-diphosphate kinase [Deltaproteobacteria bacterium]